MERGPVAPKDPVNKRPFFYIMQDKDIFGAEQADGRGVQFIYQNDNRLINSARIAGNVTEEDMLELLRTTEGFRKLVHSIGVSVTMMNHKTDSGEKEQVRFIYQMYGKTDPYVSGTNIILDMEADGTEHVIEMEQTVWSQDDKEPGQIRFEFAESGLQAQATVRFYLQDGYTAPEAIQDEKIDTTSQMYREMISRSLMQTGNTARLKKAIDKAKRGEEVTLAYIGGSITQGAGAIPIHTNCYAYQSYQAFTQKFAKDASKVHFVKAGVGGTPSELGMIRFERDILRDGSVAPDVVVVEFAVNDEGDETKGVCYDSLVRKILSLPNQPAVILLFAVFAYDWNLQDRLDVVGKTYELPMVSVKDAVTPQFGLRKEEGRVLSKNQFFYDIYHPSNMGHKIMSDCLINLFEQVDNTRQETDKTIELLEKNTAIGKRFENVRLLDRKDMQENAVISCGSFLGIDKELQCVEMDDVLEPVAQFPHNWYYAGEDKNSYEAFEMTVTCKALLLVFKDSGSIDVGKADVYVDGKKVLMADPHINGWVHCNPVIILDEETSKLHTVRIQMSQGDEDKKFTILGFGIIM